MSILDRHEMNPFEFHVISDFEVAAPRHASQPTNPAEPTKPANHVQAASAQLMLQLIEDSEDSQQVAALAGAMPALSAALRYLAEAPTCEEPLKDTLESLVSAVDAAPGFFKTNGLQDLWETLLMLCLATTVHDPVVRHSAMEGAMSFATGLAPDFCKGPGLPALEQIVSVNMSWMLEVGRCFFRLAGYKFASGPGQPPPIRYKIWGSLCSARFPRNAARMKYIRSLFFQCGQNAIHSSCCSMKCRQNAIHSSFCDATRPVCNTFTDFSVDVARMQYTRCLFNAMHAGRLRNPCRLPCELSCGFPAHNFASHRPPDPPPDTKWYLDQNNRQLGEDVAAWTALADNDNGDDDFDDASVQIGEENLDRLAEKFAELRQLEAVFMPMLLSRIQSMLQTPEASWKQTRASLMALAQVVEHIEEEGFIDLCVRFIVQHLSHQHPRVRHAAFNAVRQIAEDHEPYIQQNHHGAILPAIATALDDTNIRVATSAAAAFVSFGEELDKEVLFPHVDLLMVRFVGHLELGKGRSMQEQCLSSIAVVSEVIEDRFASFYGRIMPVLKQLIARATSEEERVLRGKAFECASLVGDAVGKDSFLADAHEIMQVMLEALRAGFSSDDPTREYVIEAAGRIAGTLEQDFKCYVSALLPITFQALARRPQELDPSESLGEDMCVLAVAQAHSL
jgi:hypothetical protein